ncbi:sugar phosphate nucleotidyltransferase, partial [Nocardia farcinica]|uniref:sugar phosphate nucleotidyltransferase n=1 Tax=Nocardia farcinica TaxID=37329 RepID=UPI002454DAC1
MTAKAGQSDGVVSCFRTAVVPAAGLGTRFLPATKTVPKELLPVVDTPGIELVATEAADSGAQRLVIVTSPGKDGVVAHFVEDLVLESTLAERGKFQLLEKVRKAPALLDVTSVVQEEPLGHGHAVAPAEQALDDAEGPLARGFAHAQVLPRGVEGVICPVGRSGSTRRPGASGGSRHQRGPSAERTGSNTAVPGAAPSTRGQLPL